MIVAAATAGLLFAHYGAKDIPYEQYKAQNNCPYEGLECPNATEALHQYADSMFIQYDNAEYTIDSLIDRNAELEVQLAGCEFQDHSRLTRNR